MRLYFYTVLALGILTLLAELFVYLPQVYYEELVDGPRIFYIYSIPVLIILGFAIFPVFIMYGVSVLLYIAKCQNQEALENSVKVLFVLIQVVYLPSIYFVLDFFIT